MSTSGPRSRRRADDDLLGLSTVAKPRDPNQRRNADEANLKDANVRLISVGRINENPDNPRFEESEKRVEAFRELVDSIAEQGLLQPIGVRRDPESPENEWRYIVVYGSRRLNACQTILLRGGEEAERIRRIPCRLLDIADPDEAFIEAVSENVAREDLTKEELYAACDRIHHIRPTWTAADIGRRIGVSRQRISTFFRIANDEVVSEAVEEGIMSTTAALEVARIEDKEARDQVVSYAREQGSLSVDDAKALRQMVAPTEPRGKYLPSTAPVEDAAPTPARGKYLPPATPPDTARPSPFTLGPVETGADHATIKDQLAARPAGQRSLALRADLITLGNLARNIEGFCQSKSPEQFTTIEREPLLLAWRLLGRFLGELPEE